MRGCVVIFLSIQLFGQIQILDAFIVSCNASLQTVTRVTMCPSDLSAYEEAVRKKNCSSLAPDIQTCQSFQYHCVLSDDLKYAIEVCAPSMIIIGHVCTKFSTRYRSIMRIAGFACNDSVITCPYGYNSTQAFLHTLCYAKISGQFTTDIPLSKEGVTKRDTIEKDKEKINNNNMWWILLVLPIMGFIIGVFFFYKWRYTVRRRTGISKSRIRTSYPSLQEEQAARIYAPLLMSREPADQLFQEDPNTMHINTTLSNEETSEREQSNTNYGNLQTDPDAFPSNLSDPEQASTNEDTTLSYEETPERVLSNDESPQQEQRNLQSDPEAFPSSLSDPQQASTIEDSYYQASTKTTLNASSERDQLMLECPVNLLIRHLRDPDESWTKEMIISHVENMIQRLVNSNEEQLFISFMKSLNNDEKIATTLLRCGKKMFELVSSIQERYSARNIAFTDGCVCVTFSFADVNDLENYLEKVRNKDEQLITDLSRILLNKTLLSIFDINPTLVTWNASELKVFKGSQLLKTEAFQETLTGSSKDFIGFSEDDATETYKKTPYFKLSEGSEDFIKKYDMFSSKEPSKYPGYMKYKTRAKSFNGAVQWMEVKKEEFAKYGFLYHGFALKTTCFHCGCLKGDWTEQDDILSTHVSLKKSCAYVQYLMEQE